MWSVDWSVGGREWISTPSPIFRVHSMQDKMALNILSELASVGLKRSRKKRENDLQNLKDGV